MPDRLSPADRKRTMRAVKSKGTGLERRLRAMLVAAGLRGWRQNPEDIPGRPDVVFLTSKVALFVDGCFWHGCPHCQRPFPQTNVEYWRRKIQRNIDRDHYNTDLLTQTGWTVIRIWEHQLRSTSDRVAILAIIRNAITKNVDNSIIV